MSNATHLTSVGTGRGDWRTPPELWADIERTFAPDYDAFASHENALCNSYSTVDGTYQWQMFGGGAGRVEISVLDGLNFMPHRDGHPRRRFANPPYGRGTLAQAVQWLAESRNEFDITVALLPDSRDTSWWRKWVAPYGTDFPIGRVRFINPETGKPGDSPPGGSVIVLWLPDWIHGGPR